MRTCVNVYGDESGGTNAGVDGVSACFPAPLCSFKHKHSSAHLDDLSMATLSHLDRVLSVAAQCTMYQASPPYRAATLRSVHVQRHCHTSRATQTVPKRYDAPFILCTPSP